ncbi:DDE-type integrase/transposase/recombinase [Chryseobacterium rhizoplanae]|uniref:Mu transposase C-terminal domain-containing protein n=1 Tax=Chryseobacterium rhizoplanae TaxID=1609531 RepID=UPI001CE2AEAF|nr:Mu transposase C-terminal domain-containing protein [Chryseobacterium rhizoplanae]UCA58628.1 DDE-type integrase/transposase/recombinase [Chryseobacterium rhizoplanae]
MKQEIFFLNVGQQVVYHDIPCIIIRNIDIKRISIEEIESGIIHTVNIGDISPVDSKQEFNNRNLLDFTDKEWEKAQERFQIIRPVLENRGNQDVVKQAADLAKVTSNTIYRWIRWYDKTGSIGSLLGEKKNGGRGKSRLSPMQEEIIQKCIIEIYLTSFRKSINYLIRAIAFECNKLGIPMPHSTTIRRRINEISEEEKVKQRYGKKISDNKFRPIRGNFPHAHYPLSVVQIDHTPVDIILVDEVFRQPFNRPYLTVAIDVYSRMILGINISFDPPGAMGTGLCISNAILAKETYLQKLGVDGSWGCWGVMETIHVDNAKEFRGIMLKKACENYGINLEFRPVATPHYGGHIERFLGSFSKAVHDLPGTTFSNTKERSTYKSEKHASFTLTEFEKWMVTYIVNVYHKTVHSGIGMTPEEKYIEGIFGNNETKGMGLPPRFHDERKIRLDFMPYLERTIQATGVVIDHIHYYDEVLRKYINTRNSNKNLKKYSFRRNPKDISVIYFFDPDLNEYFEIPYRDTRYPPMSVWEYRAAVKKWKEDNTGIINEAHIFESYKKLEEIELKAIKATKRLSKNSRRMITKEFNSKENFLENITKVNNNLELSEVNKAKASEPIDISFENELKLKPFENLDDEAFDN